MRFSGNRGVAAHAPARAHTFAGKLTFSFPCFPCVPRARFSLPPFASFRVFRGQISGIFLSAEYRLHAGSPKTASNVSPLSSPDCKRARREFSSLRISSSLRRSGEMLSSSRRARVSRSAAGRASASSARSTLARDAFGNRRRSLAFGKCGHGRLKSLIKHEAYGPLLPLAPLVFRSTFAGKLTFCFPCFPCVPWARLSLPPFAFRRVVHGQPLFSSIGLPTDSPPVSHPPTFRQSHVLRSRARRLPLHPPRRQFPRPRHHSHALANGFRSPRACTLPRSGFSS